MRMREIQELRGWRVWRSGYMGMRIFGRGMEVGGEEGVMMKKRKRSPF